MFLSKRRPTASGLIAIIALFLAVGGSTAVAAKLITGKQIKNGTIRSADIKNGTLKAADLSPGAKSTLQGPVGPAGKDGADGKDGANGANGTNGTDGKDGTAVGFAVVSGNPVAGDTVRDSGSLNVADANVTRPATGVYCFNNLAFDPRMVIATVERQHGGNPSAQQLTVEAYADAETPIGGDPCPGTEQASLLVFDETGTPANPIAINVLFE